MKTESKESVCKLNLTPRSQSLWTRPIIQTCSQAEAASLGGQPSWLLDPSEPRPLTMVMALLLELPAMFRVGQDLWGQRQSMLPFYFPKKNQQIPPKTLEQEMGANSWGGVFLSQSALPLS